MRSNSSLQRDPAGGAHRLRVEAATNQEGADALPSLDIGGQGTPLEVSREGGARPFSLARRKGFSIEHRFRQPLSV